MPPSDKHYFPKCHSREVVKYPWRGFLASKVHCAFIATFAFLRSIIIKSTIFLIIQVKFHKLKCYSFILLLLDLTSVWALPASKRELILLVFRWDQPLRTIKVWLMREQSSRGFWKVIEGWLHEDSPGWRLPGPSISHSAQQLWALHRRSL